MTINTFPIETVDGQDFLDQIETAVGDAQTARGLAQQAVTDAQQIVTDLTSEPFEISDTAGLQSALDAKASLGEDGKVIGAQLPDLFSGSYDDLANIPSDFPPSAHSQAISTITGLEAALNDKAGISHTHTLADITDSGVMAAYAEANPAQVRGFNDSALGVTTRRLREAAALIAPSGGADWTPDWSAFVSADWNVTGNRAINNPTNVIPGTTRVLKIRASTSTARAITWGSSYKGDIPDTPVTNASFLFVTLTAISSSEIVVSHLVYDA